MLTVSQWICEGQGTTAESENTTGPVWLARREGQGSSWKISWWCQPWNQGEGGSQRTGAHALRRLGAEGTLYWLLVCSLWDMTRLLRTHTSLVTSLGQLYEMSSVSCLLCSEDGGLMLPRNEETLACYLPRFHRRQLYETLLNKAFFCAVEEDYAGAYFIWSVWPYLPTYSLSVQKMSLLMVGDTIPCLQSPQVWSSSQSIPIAMCHNQSLNITLNHHLSHFGKVHQLNPAQRWYIGFILVFSQWTMQRKDLVQCIYLWVHKSLITHYVLINISCTMVWLNT